MIRSFETLLGLITSTANRTSEGVIAAASKAALRTTAMLYQLSLVNFL
ncbi:hypothetical protein [uncultured Arthrobacter sp.]